MGSRHGVCCMHSANQRSESEKHMYFRHIPGSSHTERETLKNHEKCCRKWTSAPNESWKSLGTKLMSSMLRVFSWESSISRLSSM